MATSSVYFQGNNGLSALSLPLRWPAYDDEWISPIEKAVSYCTSSNRTPISGPREGQITVMRKPTPSGAKLTPRGKEQTQNIGKSGQILWDDYSSEPAFDSAGKPSQVKPGQFDYQPKLKPIKKKQPATTAASKQNAGIMEEASRLAQRSLEVDTRPL
jgi:hypothetical protein